MSETSSTPPRSRGAALRWLLLLTLLIVTAGGGYAYWRHSEIYPTTDNAYIHANIVRIASKVAGAVERVHVADNQSVEEGDPLFDLDPAPYEASLRSERAFFDQAVDATGEAANPLRDAADRLADARRKLVEARGRLQTARADDAAQTVPDGEVVSAEQG
jgi:membrane fusion protein (multidrug efflux system)